MNLEDKAGPWTLRVWFLILNFLANAVALYGLARLLDDGTGVLFLVIGGAVTLICIGILSAPASNGNGGGAG